MGGRGSGNPDPSKDTRFAKGTSGNPAGSAGRTKDPFPKMAREMLEQVDPIDADGRTRARVLFEKLYKQAAVDGWQKSADILLDRAYGRPAQSVTMDVTMESREEKLRRVLEALPRKSDANTNRVN